jgi:hypothetical protein
MDDKVDQLKKINRRIVKGGEHRHTQTNKQTNKQTNLTIFQKGSQYFGIKVYNNLPDTIKQVSGNKNQFKKAVMQFLYLYSFYSMDEFFKCKDN